MKKIFKLLYLFLLPTVFMSFPQAYGQMGVATRKDFDLKGPVRFYKQTVYKDFHRKFESYEPVSTQISAWVLSNKEGKILFEQFPKNDSSKYYIRYLHHYKNNRYDIGLATKIKPDGTSLTDPNDYGFFSVYKYPDGYTLERYDHTDNELLDTKRYNHQDLLIEVSHRMGNKKFGYRDTYKYDKNGKIIEKNHYNVLGSLLYKYVWKRDAEGRLLTYFEYDSTGNLARRSVYTYNRAGKETSYVLYNANGTVNWGDTSIYQHDTLLAENIRYKINKNFINRYIKRKYDDRYRLERIDYLILDKIILKGFYILLKYDENGNLTTKRYYNHNKLFKKLVRSDYVGAIYQKSVQKYYDNDGTVTGIKTWKKDRYGNELSYAYYTFETKFGERVKVPVEKRQTEITYFDKDIPDVEVSLTREHKKKQDYLNIDVNNLLSSSCKVTFYTKPSVIGSHKPYVRYGIHTSAQYIYIGTFVLPYFIVKGGDEIYLFPLPDKENIAKKQMKISVKNVKKLFKK